MKKLISYFLKGLLFVVPLAVTVYVVYFIFTKVDGLLKIPIKGVGFAATLILIMLAGVLASSVFTKGLMNIVDNLFGRVPFVKLLYTSLKDLIGAFTGDKKIFDRPVLVTLLPQSNTKVLGFITKDDLGFLGVKDSVAVYVPQAYNFAGNLLIVPKEQVTPIDRDGPEVMAFIVSAGITGNSDYHKSRPVPTESCREK